MRRRTPARRQGWYNRASYAFFNPKTPQHPIKRPDMPIAIAFAASEAPLAQTARAALVCQYGNVPEDQADVIVALGGDGFMLQTLHRTQELDLPVYGMNRGTVGFLMNAYSESNLVHRLKDAQEEVLNP